LAPEKQWNNALAYNMSFVERRREGSYNGWNMSELTMDGNIIRGKDGSISNGI
jgi:hypothetical protein